MVSAAENEFVRGPAEQGLFRQTTTGQDPINILFSPLDTESVSVRTLNVDLLIVDYRFDLIRRI